MAITLEQISAACALASGVYDGTLKSGAAVNALHTEHGLNESSARDYINQYRAMMQGTVFKRTISAPALEHFLSQILQHRGEGAAKSALSAAWKHVEYYEALQHITLHRFRAVLESFKHRPYARPSVTTMETQLLAAVAQSLADPAARRRRLQSAIKAPIAVVATTTVYVRNPDVVAEVLSRANGQCELCGSAAPFLRKSNGSPYLEVHHKLQLSMGGHDSVENAIAICPNCHRREHFG